MLDAFNAFNNDENLDSPKDEKSDPRMSRQALPAVGHRAEKCVERIASDPGLNAKPAASHNSAKNSGNVRASGTKRGSAQYRKRHAILRAGVSVEHHRYKDDGIAEQDGDHRLP